MELSIVIPTRDTGDLTLKCLRALASARKPASHEIAVVDDGSGDGTADAVRAEFPRVRLIRHEVPAGFSAAANAGLRQASGAVRLLLNSDTEVDSHGLEALLNAFANDPRLGIAGARLRYPDGQPQWSGGPMPGLAWLFAQGGRLHLPLTRVPFYRRLKPLDATSDRIVDWVTGAALAMRRQVWDDVGPLDEAFRLYGQDLDFCVRAGGAGWLVKIVRNFSVMHHHGATIKGLDAAAERENSALLWRDLLRWARKHGGDRFAGRARLAIAGGARLRLVARRLARPTIRGVPRREWDARTNALQAALTSLYAEESSATHV